MIKFNENYFTNKIDSSNLIKKKMIKHNNGKRNHTRSSSGFSNQQKGFYPASTKFSSVNNSLYNTKSISFQKTDIRNKKYVALHNVEIKPDFYNSTEKSAKTNIANSLHKRFSKSKLKPNSQIKRNQSSAFSINKSNISSKQMQTAMNIHPYVVSRSRSRVSSYHPSITLDHEVVQL